MCECVSPESVYNIAFALWLSLQKIKITLLETTVILWIIFGSVGPNIPLCELCALLKIQTVTYVWCDVVFMRLTCVWN